VDGLIFWPMAEWTNTRDQVLPSYLPGDNRCTRQLAACVE